MADVRTPSTALILRGAHALVLFLPPGGPARTKSHSSLFPTSATYQATNLSKQIKSSAESESSLSVGVSKF